MNTFKNVRLSAWNDSGRKMIRLVADVDLSPEDAATRNYLERIDFYVTAQEFREFASGKLSVMQDVYTTLQSSGELCTVYRFELPSRGNYGTVNVPYVRFNLPYQVRKIMLKWAEHQWKTDLNTLSYDKRDRPEIEISQKSLDNWMRLYGCGTGKAVIDFWDYKPEESRAMFEKYMSESNSGEHSFKAMVDRLLTIVGNGTYSYLQTAKLRLMKDLDGFNFSVLNVKGKCTLNGGLVNHGRDGEHDWSIHT